MRKVFFFTTLSLDGYFEGPNHDISWHNVDSDLNEFAIEQLKEADIIMFGRRTYQLMENSWPKIANDTTTSEQNLEVARLINNINKIVFSRTMNKIEERENWRNVKLVRNFDPREIERLKKQPGGSICVGGSNLALSFIETGLIDEFRFMINPIVIGEGTTLFKGLRTKLDLELVSTRKFESGNVLLYFKPTKKAG